MGKSTQRGVMTRDDDDVVSPLASPHLSPVSIKSIRSRTSSTSSSYPSPYSYSHQRINISHTKRQRRQKIYLCVFVATYLYLLKTTMFYDVQIAMKDFFRSFEFQRIRDDYSMNGFAPEYDSSNQAPLPTDIFYDLNEDDESPIKVKFDRRWVGKLQKGNSVTPRRNALYLGSHRQDEDAVFSISDGLGLRPIALFVTTLIDSGFKGDIVLSVMEDVPEELHDFLVHYSKHYNLVVYRGLATYQEPKQTLEGVVQYVVLDGLYQASLNDNDSILEDPRIARSMSVARFEVCTVLPISILV